MHKVFQWLAARSEEHTSELQSQSNLVCRLLLEKKNKRLNLVSLLAFCFNLCLNGVASYPSLVSWITHSVDRFVIVSIFISKLRLILILNCFLGSSDSLVFSELFHSLAPRPLAARSISDFLLTYLAT